jgi:hypothetical protein
LPVVTIADKENLSVVWQIIPLPIVKTENWSF